MKTIQFHKSLGEVEITSQDAEFTMVKDLSGNTHKLMTPYLTLRDEPFPVVVSAPVVKSKYRGASKISAAYSNRLANQHQQSIASALYNEHKF